MRSHDGFYMDDNAEVEAFWSKKGIKADDIIANFLYWSILSVQMMMGDNTIGTLGANLSQVALQAAPLFSTPSTPRRSGTAAKPTTKAAPAD